MTRSLVFCGRGAAGLDGLRGEAGAEPVAYVPPPPGPQLIQVPPPAPLPENVSPPVRGARRAGSSTARRTAAIYIRCLSTVRRGCTARRGCTGCTGRFTRSNVAMSLVGLVLLVVLVLLLVGTLPTWPYSGGWGYGPSGILVVVLVIVLILVLFGRF